MKSRIMLVEDHPVMRESSVQLINRSDNLEVCVAVATAEEALELYPLLLPDLVIVDISLPGMSGIDLVSLLRSNNPELPILIVTGHADEYHKKKALQAGASRIVFKDEGPKALLAALDAVRLQEND